MKTLFHIAIILSAAVFSLPAFASNQGNAIYGQTDFMRAFQVGAGSPAGGYGPVGQGKGRAVTNNGEQPNTVKNAGQITPKFALFDAQKGLSGADMALDATAGAWGPLSNDGAIDTKGQLVTGQALQYAMGLLGSTAAAGMNAPDKQTHAAKSNLDAQGSEVANNMADLEKQQAASAIDFCASFLPNFTTDGSNKWNTLRNNLFLPMAILLLLPGAIATQARAIIAQGNPVLGEINPLEGLQRSLIAIFLIPGTYLVLNYSIDFNNSVIQSISEEYTKLFGADMYRDAISFHIRAFPSRQPGENRNALDQQTANMTPLLGGRTPFAMFEGKMIESKIEDPVAGIYQAPIDRADEALASSAIMAKTMFNSTNATFMIAWNILCAFQMVYFYYLWFVGPITGALWAWPMKSLRNAFPSWCEGVVTLGFWSLFWHTSILLMACFRGVDETGTIVLTALNFLATSSVKYAFDFAGLAKAAGQEAAQLAEKAAQQAGKGGGGGGGGGGGHGGGGKHKHGSGSPHKATPHTPHTPNKGAETPNALPKGPSADGDGVRPRSLAEEISPMNGPTAPVRVQVASADAPEAFRMAALANMKPPPTGGDSQVRDLPGNSFKVGDNTFTRSNEDGRAVMRITGADGQGVVGADGKTLGAIDIDNAANKGPIAFQGGSLSIDKDKNGGELYHASSGGHTELVSFHGGALHGHAGAAVDPGMHAAMQSGKAMAELAPGVFTDGNGNYYDIDHNQIQQGADGKYGMNDGSGRSFSVDGTNGNSNVHMFNANGQNTDNYHLKGHIGDAHGLGVVHTDGHGHKVDSFGMKQDSTGIHSFHRDAHGHLTDTADMNGLHARHAYYNPDNQHLLGSSNTNFDANGNSTTNFYRDDNSLVGSNQYEVTPDGYKDVMYDADGNAVSYEQANYSGDGYSMTTAQFDNGQVTQANYSTYDNNGVMQSNIPLEHQKMSAAEMANMMPMNNSASPWGAPASSGVVPDGGVFGSAAAQGAGGNQPFVSASKVDVVPPIQFDTQNIANHDHSRDVAPSDSKVLPVDLAGSALNTEFSQIGGAYAAQASGQGNTAEVAYSSPVTTSNIDVVPPNIWDNSTPIAYQNPEKFGNVVDNRPSLESALSDKSGEIQKAVDAATRFNFNSEQVMPPTSSFLPRESSDSSGAAPYIHSSQIDVAPGIQIDNSLPGSGNPDMPKDGAPGESSRVLPVDLAGTSLNTEFSQIGGAYAAQASGQANTAEVAYSSPVTTSNIDVVPPNVWDNSTPIAYQDPGKIDNAVDNRPSLESSMADKSGELKNAMEAAQRFNLGQDAMPPTQFTLPRESTSGQIAGQTYNQDGQTYNQDGQTYNQSGQAYTQLGQAADQTYNQFVQNPQAPQVLPVDIAGTQGGTPQASDTTEFSQVGGAYSQVQASQGNTAEVAYTSPLTSRNADVAPPTVQAPDNTYANQLAREQMLPPADSYSNQIAYQAPNQYDNTVDNRASLEQIAADRAGQISAASPDTTYRMDAVDPPTGDTTHVTHSPDQSVSNEHSHYTEAPQVVQGPVEQGGLELPRPRTESAAQIASAAAVAMNAQQHVLGDAKTPIPPGAGVKTRGLGTIFSDITMGKKTVKPNGPAGAAPAKPGQPGQPQDPNTRVTGTGGPNDARAAGPAEPPVSTNQSLQRQMMDAGAHVQAMPGSSKLGSILNRAGSASTPQKPNEHLTSALVDYHTVTSLLHDGKANEAALVAANAMENITKCNGTEPQLLPLVKAFVTLFQQKNMIHQARMFAETERALEEFAQKNAAGSAPTNDNNNIWGS